MRMFSQIFRPRHWLLNVAIGLALYSLLAWAMRIGPL